MRIVFLNPVSAFGGAERSLLSWIGAVRCAMPGARPVLVLPGNGPLADRAESLGITVERLDMPAELSQFGDSQLRGASLNERVASTGPAAIAAIPGVWRYVRDLDRLLTRLSPDLIHSNGIKSHLALSLSRAFGHRGGTPVVWHIHDYLGQRPLVARLAAMGSGGVSLGIAVSKSVAADARAIRLRMPLRVVYNVIDPAEFSPAVADGALLDHMAGLSPAPNGVVRVVLVATYARWKGHDVFLQAAEVARRAAGAPLRFYIVGGPIYSTAGSQYSREELQTLVNGSGLADGVGFVDFQSHPAAIYRAADIVVHASTRPEPFGLTIVEAMACGRAVVVSQGGGAAELFEPGVDAVGVEPGNALGLAGAIRSLADDVQFRERLGQKARESAVARFGNGALPRQVATCYRTVLDQWPSQMDQTA